MIENIESSVDQIYCNISAQISFYCYGVRQWGIFPILIQICNRKCEAELFDTTKKISEIYSMEEAELIVGSCSLYIHLKHLFDKYTVTHDMKINFFGNFLSC